MSPPLHISRRLMTSSTLSYLETVQQFGTLFAFYPLDDFATHSTSPDSIIETIGGSDGTQDYHPTITETVRPVPSRIVKGYSSSTRVGQNSSFYTSYLGNFDHTGLSLTKWVGLWMRRVNNFNTTASNQTIISVAGGAFGQVDMALSGATWSIYQPSFAYGNVLTVTGKATTDATSPHLYVWTQEDLGSGNYRYKCYIAIQGQAWEVQSTDSTTLKWGASNLGPFIQTGVSFGEANGQFDIQAFSVSYGAIPANTTDIMTLYNAAGV